jgi:hypothetical protein
MGTAAVTWRHWSRRAIYLGLGCTLFVSLVPTWQYRPHCDTYTDYFMDGPLRPAFVDQVERAMDEAGMLHLRIGDRIYQPYLPLFDGLVSVEMPGIPWDRYDIRHNVEWRLVKNMAYGTLSTGETIEPPPALLAAIEATRDEYGPFPPAERYASQSDRFDDCQVKRAGAIRVEDLE